MGKFCERIINGILATQGRFNSCLPFKQFYKLFFKLKIIKKMKIEIDVEDYIDLLKARRDFVVEKYGWREMPECLWDYFTEIIRECGIGGDTSPSNIMDNAIVNGDWGDFDDYMQKDETDEDFVRRVENETMFIDENERIVCFSI
jgi:hypothetical protein